MIKGNKWISHLLAVLFMLLVNVIYFYPQIEGKVLNQGDLVSSDQAWAAIAEYQKKTGKTYLWNPAQFAGMPALTDAPNAMNLVSQVYGFYNMMLNDPIGMYFMGMLLAYVMMIFLGVSPIVAALLSVPVMFATGNVILWEAGHAAKIRTLIFTPLLIVGVLKIFEEKKYLLGFILLTLGFSLSFYARHPQMTYYVLLSFLVYGIVYLIYTIKQKDWAHFAKGAVLVIGAVVLGGGTSASKVWTLYDYSKVTMRGDAILKAEEGGGGSSSNVDGLDWEYATQWSNGFVDLMAMYIPGFAGGGSGEKVGTDSESFKRYRIKNAPLYWGDLPFTVGPLYVGASVIFLFVLGLFLVKGNLKWWLGIGMIWLVLLSMGDHFSAFNRFIFENFPFYSKFRAPQTVLNTASFFFVLLAALAIKEIWNNPAKKSKKGVAKHEFEKPLWYSFGISGGVALFFALIGPSLFSFSGQGDAQYIQQGVDMSIFIKDRKDLMVGDSWRTFFIVTILAGLIFLYLKGKLNQVVMILGIGAVVLIDLMGVNWRYLDHSKYIRPNQLKEQTLAPRPVDLQIQQAEPDRARYRVHDLTINSFNSSSTSAFHNTIGGYDPAKMQRYQDLIERHISRNNQNVFNMLNTKYFIFNNNGETGVQRNEAALGNAWMVNQVMKVNSPEEEINALNSINPAETAVILDSEFSGYMEGWMGGKGEGDRIDLVEYEPDRLVYKSTSMGESFAVFSEMWYGPNKGWKVYLDGKEVEHVRVNYALRGMRIPSGEHEIVFDFMPRSIVVGERISLASSIILLGLIFLFIFRKSTLKNEKLN